MLTIDVLISVVNAQIARLKDLPQNLQEGVRFIISFQYTDEKYLEMIPAELKNSPDISIVMKKERGLSVSRNAVLGHATADLIYFIDDDTHLLPDTFATIRKTFEENPDVDIAAFEAQTYSGDTLREYPQKGKEMKFFELDLYKVLACETVCRRGKVQGTLHYDGRFGLGSHCALCYEQQVFLAEALKAGLKIEFFKRPIVQTSAIFKPMLIFVDRHVQISLGCLIYYLYGLKAYQKAFYIARTAAQNKCCKFWPYFTNMLAGISKLRKTT